MTEFELFSSPEKNSKPKPKLIIIDDNPIIIKSLIFVLKPYFQITHYLGLDDIPEDEIPKFKVVLLDVKMPHHDGIEVFEYIKKIKPETKIIFHSAYPGASSVADQINLLPHDGYLIKGQYTNEKLVNSLINAFG